jgi:hypothetical protein
MKEAWIGELEGERSVIEDLMSWRHQAQGAAKRMGGLVGWY